MWREALFLAPRGKTCAERQTDRDSPVWETLETGIVNHGSCWWYLSLLPFYCRWTMYVGIQGLWAMVCLLWTDACIQIVSMARNRIMYAGIGELDCRRSLKVLLKSWEYVLKSCMKIAWNEGVIRKLCCGNASTLHCTHATSSGVNRPESPTTFFKSDLQNPIQIILL